MRLHHPMERVPESIVHSPTILTNVGVPMYTTLQKGKVALEVLSGSMD